MSWAAGLLLVCRADATPAIGAGHAMRLAALGAAWRSAGGRVVFAGELSIPFVRDRIRGLGFSHEGAAPDHADLLVVDSYDPAIRYRRQMADAMIRVLVDDVGGPVPPGFDAVWNPNAYGSAALYPGYAGVVIAGTDSVPVRDDLPPWNPAPPHETVVAVGGGTPPITIRDALGRLAALLPDEPFAIAGGWAPAGWRVIAPPDLWRSVGRARRMVAAAGTTVWEAASVRIPVVLLQTADNQRFVYRWGRDAGVPGLNALLVDGEFLAHQLRSILPAARPLPAVSNGAPRVAQWLGRMVDQRNRV